MNKLIVVIFGIVRGIMIFWKICNLLLLLICVDLMIVFGMDVLKKVCMIKMLYILKFIGKINV